MRYLYINHHKQHLGRRHMPVHSKGEGIGSFVLDNGLGGQNSYESIPAYEHATHRMIERPNRKGEGLPLKGLINKISSLNIKSSSPKKPKNIVFKL